MKIKIKHRQAYIYLLIWMYLIITPGYGQSNKDSLQYSVDLNLSGRRFSGTFNQAVFRSGFNLDFLYKNWHLENRTTYRYNKTNTILLEDNWNDLITLKYYPKGSKKLYPGLFSYFDNNLIYRINKRHNYGVGLGSELDRGKMELSLLGAIAQGNSTYNGSEFVNSDRDISTRKNGLFLFILENGYSIAENKINFSYRFLYFQSLLESADFIIQFNPRININVYKGLSFFVVYNYRFENVHLESLSNYNDFVLYGFSWGISG